MDLNSVFKEVSQGPSIFAEDYQDRTWNIVVSDIVGTLVMRHGVWRAYERLLLWLEDQGAEIILVSSDPLYAHHKMAEEGCDPRLLDRAIEQKTSVYAMAHKRQENIAVAVDDELGILLSQHIRQIINPNDSKFRHFVETRTYAQKLQADYA